LRRLSDAGAVNFSRSSTIRLSPSKRTIAGNCGPTDAPGTASALSWGSTNDDPSGANITIRSRSSHDGAVIALGRSLKLAISDPSPILVIFHSFPVSRSR
jgi:hypothetical protein